MTAAKRLATCLIGMVVALAALAFAWQGASSRPPSSNVFLPAGEEIEVLRRRGLARERVVDRLLEGEMSLPQAAAWFRYLNDNPREYRLNYRELWPGNSDGEKLCRQVIQWVKNHLHHRGKESQTEAITSC